MFFYHSLHPVHQKIRWQLQIICRIWLVLTLSTVNAAVWGAIISHLYHFSSLPTGLPTSTFLHLQSNFNTPDEAICLKHRSDSITPLLKIPPYLIQSKSQNLTRPNVSLSPKPIWPHLPTSLFLLHLHCPWQCVIYTGYALTLGSLHGYSFYPKTNLRYSSLHIVRGVKVTWTKSCSR